jgi:hypothetical protein
MNVKFIMGDAVDYSPMICPFVATVGGNDDSAMLWRLVRLSAADRTR